MSVLQRILYVEDEADIRAVATVALQMLGGFTLKVCSSGMEALQSAEAFQPQLVLMDVVMPGMDGIATYCSLRQLPGMDLVPVVFMTGKVQPHERENYLALGVAAILAKPFDALTLASQIQNLWKELS